MVRGTFRPILKAVIGVGQRNGTRYAICPCYGKKGFYRVRCSYERCRYCGRHKILLPGRDFQGV